jgi:hypothetical protein
MPIATLVVPSIPNLIFRVNNGAITFFHPPMRQHFLATVVANPPVVPQGHQIAVAVYYTQGVAPLAGSHREGHGQLIAAAHGPQGVAGHLLEWVVGNLHELGFVDFPQGTLFFVNTQMWMNTMDMGLADRRITNVITE